MCRNDELSSTMSWVGYLIKYSELFILFAENSQILPKISLKFHLSIKGRLSYHLCVKCFSQLSFDSEVYTKSATAADFVYISESNESCEKHSTQR